MLIRHDPFRDFDRFFAPANRTPNAPLDAYRRDDAVYVDVDLPGVAADSIELTVERNVLTVHAERRRQDAEGVELLIGERPQGTFSRQLFLGDTLDTDHLEATYEAGVLTLRIPVAEQAKPRKISITATGEDRKKIDA